METTAATGCGECGASQYDEECPCVTCYQSYAPARLAKSESVPSAAESGERLAS